MLPLNKALDLSDFSDTDLVAALRDIFPHEVSRFGPRWPGEHEYRKDWEVGMAILALTSAGAIHPDAQILGVGAGNEPTIFYLTNLTRSVHATDLYLADPHGNWAESANVNMFLDPGRYWPRTWNPRRLVVQHMNGLELRYEDESFDGIFSSGSIEHFGGYPEVRQAAREMARVLKPGGVLSISTEYRLAGPGPGLPGILMFTEAELVEHIVAASGLEMLGPFDSRCSPRVAESADEFARASGNVQAHVAEHGEILFHKLTWPGYPVVALRQGERVWTSCHLALRKEGGVRARDKVRAEPPAAPDRRS
jgi:SAM-dependent methyltransferase